MLESRQNEDAASEHGKWSRVGLAHKLPLPKPSDWGIGMSICIAAIAGWSRIVLATDQMISAQDFSGDEMTLKIKAIHRNWAMMFASNDISNVGPVFGEVHRGLTAVSEKKTLRAVRRVVLDAYQTQHLKKVNANLAPLDLALGTFKEQGRQLLGDSIFEQLFWQINQLSLDSQFLVAGYDEERQSPHIFEVSRLADPVSHDVLGFAAIGSGNHSALGSLYFHSYNRMMDLPTAFYHVCEAKFMAESAMGVGKQTSVLLMHRSGEDNKIVVHEAAAGFLEEIRAKWEAEGKPRLPQSIDPFIKEGMKDAQRFFPIVFD